jgi:hypothetical protein
MAAVGVAEKRDDSAPVGDEPRPTRGNRMPRRSIAPELVSAEEEAGLPSAAPVSASSPRTIQGSTVADVDEEASA